jgi:hypothetical protein
MKKTWFVPVPLAAVSLAVLFLLAGCDAVDPAAPGASHTAGVLSANRTHRVNVCHRRDGQGYILISVADAAYNTHIAHGDAGPGEEVPGTDGTYRFDDSCVPVAIPQGLRAMYYHMTGPCVGCTFPNGTFVAERVESTIDHFVEYDSYWPGVVNADLFSAQWTGFVRPLYAEAYTFCVRTDDGSRLWIDDVMIVDSWIPQVTTEHCSVPVSLQAGQKYSLRLEFFEDYGWATTELRWQSVSQSKQIVPQSALFAN